MKTAAARNERAQAPEVDAGNSGSARLAPKPYGVAFADSGGLVVGHSDGAEPEAGDLAEQSVADVPLLRPARAPPAIRRVCAACEEEQGKTVVRRKASEGGALVTPPAVSSLLSQPGQSLDPAAKSYFEGGVARGVGATGEAPGILQRWSEPDRPNMGERGPRVQPQLEIGRVDDPFEIEADQMADHVVRRMSADVDDRSETPTLQAKAEHGVSAMSASPGLDAGVAAATGSGASLGAETRDRMEGAFDADFSAVRVHTGAASAAMCDEIGARAFTYGSDIHFNAGEFAPGTQWGTRLLAHELTHVVQQNASVRRAPRRVQRAQLGPRVFGPTTGMPKGNLIHNEGLLPTFKAPGLNPGLWVEPRVPGANGSFAAPGLWGKPDFYRDKADGRLIGINQGKLTAFTDLSNVGMLAPRPPAMPGGPVQDLNHAPKDIELGDVKPGNSGEEHLGRRQLANYAQGIKSTAKAVNDYQDAHQHSGHWDLGLGSPSTMNHLDVPDRLAKPGPSGVRFGPLAVWEWIGMWKFRSATQMKGSCVVYKSSVPGIWAYEWMPVSVPENVGSDSNQKKLSDRLEKDVKPRLHSSKKKAPKLKARPVPDRPARSVGPARRIIRRQAKEQHEKFDEQGWLNAYNPWRADAEKALADPKTGQNVAVLDALMESKKRTGFDPGIPQVVTERAQGFAAIRHWVRYGRIYGWFRKTFDRVYVKLADFAQKVKEKVKKLSRSGPGGGFGNWVKAAALALFKVAKKLGAWALSIVVDKLVESLKEGVINIIKQIADAVTPEGVKSKIEEAEELKDKFEEMLRDAQESLERRLFGDKLEFFSKLQWFMDIANTVSTIVSVVKWGIRIVSCASPPLLGCLWNLAVAALEYAFSKIMETCWFSAKVYGWVRDTGIKKILDFPTEVAGAIADKINDVVPLPAGIGPLFAKIEVNDRFKIDCSSGSSDENGGGPEPTEEQKALMEVAREVGDEKFEAFLEMAAKRAADANVALDAERIRKLGALIKSLTVEQMKELAANKPTQGVPVPVEEFLKSIATLNEKETERKEARNIDYEKAQRSNPAFEKTQIKWKPELFVRPGIASDSKEFADAVYDVQKMLGIKADGMAGPTTTKTFYERNNQPRDEAYKNAAELVEEEKQARAENQAREKRRRELKGLLKDEKIKAALEAPFPSEDELKKDLTALTWANLEDGTMQFIERNGRPIIGIKTDAGHSLGAYFHYVERQFPGTKSKMKMIVVTSRFYTLDGIPPMDGIGNLVTFEDGSTGLEMIALKEQKKDSFFEMPPIFFGKFVDF